MAIILPKTENISCETQRFCQNIEAAHETIGRFGNIKPFVAPHEQSVRQYSIKKLTRLFFEKMEWRSNRKLRDRRIFDRQVAKELILSENFGEPKIFHYGRFCVLIKTCFRAQAIFPHLPRVHEGIGINYFDHMEKFIGLLEGLLGLSRGKRNELMLGIRLSEKFIDMFVGQFIYDFFWFMISAGKYPLQHYPAVRYR